MKTVWLLKVEDKEGGGDEYTIVYSTRAAAEADLQERAGICVGEHEWLDQEYDCDGVVYDSVKEQYEMAGDFVQEKDEFYLADILQLSIEETVVQD